jgi:hypothetical protein
LLSWPKLDPTTDSSARHATISAVKTFIGDIVGATDAKIEVASLEHSEA